MKDNKKQLNLKLMYIKAIFFAKIFALSTLVMHENHVHINDELKLFVVDYYRMLKKYV